MQFKCLISARHDIPRCMGCTIANIDCSLSSFLTQASNVSSGIQLLRETLDRNMAETVLCRVELASLARETSAARVDVAKLQNLVAGVLAVVKEIAHNIPSNGEANIGR